MRFRDLAFCFSRLRQGINRARPSIRSKVRILMYILVGNSLLEFKLKSGVKIVFHEEKVKLDSFYSTMLDDMV